MHHFFAEPSDIKGHDLYIRESGLHHMRNVLRLRRGDVVSVSDGVTDREYRCHIEDFSDDSAHLRLDFIKEAGTELPVRVTLFQGLPKAGKMDFIIEKCTELGVFSIVPVIAERSVSRPGSAEKAEAKRTHWQAKAEAAAKQCRRGRIPEVSAPVSFEEAVQMAEKLDLSIIPYELSESGFSGTRKILERIRTDSDFGVIIGPEGGIAEDEIALAVRHGIKPVTLGKRILRTETAGMVVMSWINYVTQDS